MSASRNSLIAGLALLLAAPAIAQPPDDEPGRPRSLMPGSVRSSGLDEPSPPAEDAGAPDDQAPDDQEPDARAAPSSDKQDGAPRDGDRETTRVRPQPSVLGNARGGAVEIGSLGTPEGPIAGTLGPDGLGADMWNGATRSTIDPLLRDTPAAGWSPTSRLLLREVLLTPAGPPAGDSRDAVGPISFNGLRLQKLLEAGLYDDAAQLALQMDLKRFPGAAAFQAEAFLLAGNDEAACGDATAARLDNGDTFWIRLRAYCYALAGDAPALEFTRSIMTAQSLSTPAFDKLLDTMTAKKPAAPAGLGMPGALDIRLLERAKLALPREAAGAPDASIVLKTLRSVDTPKDIRQAAAMRGVERKILNAGDWDVALGFYAFKPADLIGAPAIARREQPLPALARLKAALAAAKTNEARAELVYSAFSVADDNGVLAPAAAVFADTAAGIEPQGDWSPWAPAMIRGLILADRADAAMGWYRIFDGSGDQLDEETLLMGLASPQTVASAEVALALSHRAEDNANGPRNANGWDALILGLYDALGRPMPFDARAAVSALFGGRDPRGAGDAALERIDRASLANRKGELALLVRQRVGTGDAGDLAPAVAIRMVRALVTAGMPEAARSLALEAAILYRGVETR